MISAAELRARVVVEGVPKGNKELGVFEGSLKRVAGLDATATLHADIDQRGFNTFEGELRDASGRSATATLEADVHGRGFDEFAARVDAANLRTSRPITQTVRAEVDDTSFTVTMARVRALKAQVDRESGGGGLAHSAGGIIAPFGALPTLAAAASPELLALAGAATAVAGSAGEAALGVGTLVGGLYGAGAVGISGIVAVAVPAVHSLKELTKAQTAYSQAVRIYGAESSEAETALKKLNAAEKEAGPEAVKLAGALGHVKHEWASLTAPGRNEFLGALADGVDHLEGKLPVLAKSANRSTSSMRHDFDLFLNQVTGKGSGFDHFIGSMTDLFVHEGPMISHTLGDWLKIFEHIAEAAGPSLERETKTFEHWSDSILHSTENAPKLRREIGGLVDQTDSWLHFLGQGADLIFTIFGAGAGQGQRLVDDSTGKLEEWRHAIEGDPSGTESFFEHSVDETRALSKVLGGLIQQWAVMATAAEPIDHAVLDVVDALNSLKVGNVSALTLLIGGGFAVGSAAKLAKTVEILKGYGAITGLLRTEQAEQEAVAAAQGTGVGTADALTAANERLAVSIQGVTAAQAEQATGQLSMLEAGAVGKAEQAGQLSMFPMGGGVMPPPAATAAEETAAGTASAGLLAKGMKLALPAAIGAIGIGNIVTSATSGDWQDAGFEAGGALAGGVVGAFVGGPAGAMIGTGVGSVLGEVVSGLFEAGLGPLQSEIVATSKHAAASFQAQKESSEALAVAQEQLRGAQSRALDATDELSAAERRLHRLREGDASTTAQVLGAEAQVADARHRRAQSVQQETKAYENVRLAEGANRQTLVEGVAAANLAIAADQKHVDKLNERWQTERHGKELTEEVTRATGKLAVEEAHRTHLLEKAEQVSNGFQHQLEGLTLAQSEYGTRGHVLTAQLGEVHAKIHALEVQAAANPLKPMAGELSHLRGEAGKLEAKLIRFLTNSGPHLREWATSGVHQTRRFSGGFEALSGSVAEALEEIQTNTAGVLRSFGAAKIPGYQVHSMLHAFGKAEGGPGIGSVPELASGGIVPGVATGDVHRTAVPSGSFILNKVATAAYGFQEGGSVPVVLEPGERYFHPDEVAHIGLGNLMAMNESAPRFAKGGLAAEPRITGPAGALLDLGHAAVHRAYAAARKDVKAHRPKRSAVSLSGGLVASPLEFAEYMLQAGFPATVKVISEGLGTILSESGFKVNNGQGPSGHIGPWAESPAFGSTKVREDPLGSTEAAYRVGWAPTHSFWSAWGQWEAEQSGLSGGGAGSYGSQFRQVAEEALGQRGGRKAKRTGAAAANAHRHAFAAGGLVGGDHPRGVSGAALRGTNRGTGSAGVALLLKQAKSSSTSKSQKTIADKMLAEMRVIDGTPYGSGGHGGFEANPSTLDCSSAVSFELIAGGLLGQPLDSVGLESWGQPGPNSELTVYTKGPSGPEGHAWMEFFGRPWGTSVGDSGAGGLGWHPEPSAGYKAQFKARHAGVKIGGAPEGGPEGSNPTTETVPGEFDGAHTQSLTFPSPGKTAAAVEAEIRHWEGQLRTYKRAARQAKANGKTKTAHAIEQNVAAIEQQLRVLGRALRDLRRKAAEKRTTAHLNAQLGHLTGLEPGIEKAQRRFNVAEQFAQQVVDLEPTIGEGEGVSGVDLPTYLRYINQQEVPAYERVLAAEAEWRNMILHAERRAAGDWDHGKPHVGGMEGGWEDRIENIVGNEQAIEAFAAEVQAELDAFHRQHPKADLTDRLKARRSKRNDLLAKLPLMQFTEKELRKTLGEGRGLFYPGGARITEPKPPLAGTGTFEGYLEEVQGIHWPGQHEFLAGLPHKRQAGSFGGSIWSTQGTIEELGLSMAGAIAGATEGLGSVPEGEGGEGGGASQSQVERLELELQLARQQNERYAVGQALSGVLDQFEQSYPTQPYMGAFAAGGVALVGEQGPELAHLPSGTRVHSAGDTQAMLSPSVRVVVNGHIHRMPGDTRDPIEVLLGDKRLLAKIEAGVRATRQGLPFPTN